MVFNSLHFVVFFPIVYALYRALPTRAQNWMLLAASYYFYGSWDWRFLGLLIGSTVVDFWVGRYLGVTESPARRRMALILSLVYNLGVLGFFKYFNFFAENLVEVFDRLGWHLDPLTVNVILPMGISFYTFMTISYVIDVYRRDIQPTTNFIDFALFVSYFPHLVAGPVLRASLLLPQISRPSTSRASRSSRASGSSAGATSRRCTWPTIWRNGRRGVRSGGQSVGRGRAVRHLRGSRSRPTAISPATRTLHAAFRS